MLPAAARLTSSQEFRLAVRRGRRAGRARLVVHLLVPNAAPRTEVRGAAVERAHQVNREGGDRHDGTTAAHPASSELAGRAEPNPASAAGPRSDSDIEPTRDTGEPARVGFVVSKAVGNAVLRHRVTRRLRHLMRDRLDALPAGTLVVVRALPPAATASSSDLGSDLDAALRKLRVVRGGPVTGP
ncbi:MULTISPECIES: ribonuclease P protein component [unclassified Saccharopolyspora]|uniref:ribonuclease P protein component n=1 Tax=unclassified Saccharopolyspora TaxID=2646250 RepID=UPI001CD535B5|nr:MULTISPECIES: ribonuclease P protein component [unclassified Saccharopolyspora]MCA1191821.1 ribonuclease P protein component [Saccharopolyspora sp. 6V]MCA1226030.1 ribonuclease P protein component [Saccharopolyspora sp. 6M]MCA1281669.1 ribonuclease P protein component [Saccharopolyspora sp. 7B]